MKGRVSPALIGAFVLGGLALLVAGILVLSNNLLFGKSDDFLIYFDETVKGLRVGAPVAYRGVEIGEVFGIQAVLDPASNQLRVPVTVRLRKKALVLEGGGEPNRKTMAGLVRHGLAAQLQLDSLVTARLYVSLDFFPENEPRFGGRGDGQIEIPSVRSPLAGILSSVDQLTMAAPQLIEGAKDVLQQLRQVLGGDTGQELRRGLDAGTNLLTMLADPNSPFQTTLTQLPDTLATFRSTASALDSLTAQLNKTLGGEQLEELMGELVKTSASARKTADQAGQLISQNRANIQVFTERGLPELVGLVEDANRMVNELNGLIRDIRQNPVRFLLGDPSREGVKLR